MKLKSKIALGIAVGLIVAGGAFFVVYSFHLPDAGKSLDEIGLVISRSRLADVGYDTPEAALETDKWAWANTNYDKMLDSVSLEIRRTWESATNGRLRFEVGRQKPMSSFEKIHVLAKKKTADDQGELKLATEQKQGDVTFAVASIQQMVKTSDGWRVGIERNFDPAWDKNSQPEPAVRR